MKSSALKIGILGYGEIGQAMAKFYKNPLIKDLKRDDGLQGVDILHVCIPWSDKFLSILEKEIKQIQPGLTIIHSTVAPGTTKQLAKKFSRKVVHSPVRGTHPYLYEGIKHFVKYIGADDKKVGQLAKIHFDTLKIKTKVFSPSVTTELGKLLDTSYYGVCIAWHGEMKKMADELGVNFDEAVTDFNTTYNEAYTKLGGKRFVRPILYPPSKHIGGHCVVPNAKILKKNFKSRAVDLILDYANKQER